MKRPAPGGLKAYLEGAADPPPQTQPHGTHSKPAATGQKRTSLDLPTQLHSALKLAAVQEQRPFRAVVVQAVCRYLEIDPGTYLEASEIRRR